MLCLGWSCQHLRILIIPCMRHAVLRVVLQVNYILSAQQYNADDTHALLPQSWCFGHNISVKAQYQ